LQPKRVTVFPFGKFDKILEFEFDWRQVFSYGGIQSKSTITITIIKYEQKVAKIPRLIHNETQRTLEETESNIHKDCKVYFSPFLSRPLRKKNAHQHEIEEKPIIDKGKEKQ
jgi:hypothetical protein